MTETAVRPAPKVGYDETALRLPKRLTLDEWLDICKGLGAMSRAHQWWIGDALNEGERRYGEEAAQAEVVLGIAAQTLLNWKWIAAAVEVSRRREEVTYSHHAEVARLEPADQDRLLATAIENLWTVRQLRDAVALEGGALPPSEPEPSEHAKLTDADQAAIARRLETLQSSYEDWIDKAAGQADQLGRFFDQDDVAWLLRTLRHLTRSGT